MNQDAGRGSAVRQRAFAMAWRAYVRELWSYRGWSLPCLLLPSLGSILIFYVPPLVVARLVGRLSAGEGDGQVLSSVLLFAGSFLVGNLLVRAGDYSLNRAGSRGIAQLYTSGLDALLEKDATFFHDSFAGALTKRVVGYAARYAEFLQIVSQSVIANLLPLVFACVVLWRQDPRLVLALVGLLALTSLAVLPLIRRRQLMVDEREATSARLSGSVADVLGGMDAVRTFAAQQRESASHRRRVDHLRRITLRSWDYSTLRIDLVVTVGSVLTNALGLYLATRASGRAELERLVVVVAYYLQSTQILFEFNGTYRQLETTLTEAAQFTELLLEPPAVVDPPEPEPLAPQDFSVRFDHVAFAHAGAGPLFEGLDLTVAAGERIGLVGRSGGGKTTLTRLLLRQMDLQGGAIRIGGQDISRLRQADLRSLVSYVPQDPAMFHRSLRDNIAYGRPDATQAEVLAAAETAHVRDFIEGLPEGFDTLVGERGVKLSGGQRQRVAIARAVLRDAPVLVLDEATSALDSESEALVQDALWRLMAGRTALVVAHRLSTVAQMDRLVVLDRGQVVESGTHDGLLSTGGTYASLWARQSGGFLAPAAG